MEGLPPGEVPRTPPSLHPWDFGAPRVPLWGSSTGSQHARSQAPRQQGTRTHGEGQPRRSGAVAAGRGRGGARGAAGHRAPSVGVRAPGCRGTGLVQPCPQAPALGASCLSSRAPGLAHPGTQGSHSHESSPAQVLVWVCPGHSSHTRHRPFLQTGPRKAGVDVMRWKPVLGSLGGSEGAPCPKAAVPSGPLQVWEGTRSATGGGCVEGPHLAGQTQGERCSLCGTRGGGALRAAQVTNHACHVGPSAPPAHHPTLPPLRLQKPPLPWPWPSPLRQPAQP